METLKELLFALLCAIGLPLGVILIDLGIRILRADPDLYEELRQKTKNGEYVTDKELSELLRIQDK